MPRGVYPRPTPEERFWSKVKQGSVPVHRPELGPCLVWTGAVTEGYGRFCWQKPKLVLAHRAAWFFATGEWPQDDLFVCHHCDNRPCVRYEHLFVGTQLDNLGDAATKLRVHPGEAHGHATLTDAVVLAIRAEDRSTQTIKQIARKYGIATSHASKILSGALWRHLPIAEIGGPNAAPRVR